MIWKTANFQIPAKTLPSKTSESCPSSAWGNVSSACSCKNGSISIISALLLIPFGGHSVAQGALYSVIVILQQHSLHICNVWRLSWRGPFKACRASTTLWRVSFEVMCAWARLRLCRSRRVNVPTCCGQLRAVRLAAGVGFDARARDQFPFGRCFSSGRLVSVGFSAFGGRKIRGWGREIRGFSATGGS